MPPSPDVIDVNRWINVTLSVALLVGIGVLWWQASRSKEKVSPERRNIWVGWALLTSAGLYGTVEQLLRLPFPGRVFVYLIALAWSLGAVFAQLRVWRRKK